MIKNYQWENSTNEELFDDVKIFLKKETNFTSRDEDDVY